MAWEFGLVNRIFPDESFAEDVTRYVSEFETMSRSAMSLTKTLLYQMDGCHSRKHWKPEPT